MFGLGFSELLLVALVLPVYGVLVGLPACLICRRIGLPTLLGLLAIIPLINLVLLWYVALARWPSSPNREELTPVA